MRSLLVALIVLVCSPLSASELSVFVGSGKSLKSWHGQASFRDIEFEYVTRWRLVERFISKTDAGVSVMYSDIRQPRSWFGDLYGDGTDSVRGENAYFFLRRNWREGTRMQPYVELGTGPMWSNRRVPAATSRLNFDSQLGIGARLFAGTHPLFIVYRFSHISNLAFGDQNPGHAKRNPGWNVNTILIGTRIHKFRR